MTPQEKAIELRDKYIFTSFIIDEDYDSIKSKLMLHAKRSALIAVGECLHTCVESMVYYWEEVKQQIEQL
jgi:hypothetical protein